MQDSTLLINGLKTTLIWCSNHILEIIVFISIFLEVAKIKVNPISALGKLFFRSIRKEISDFREETKKEIADFREETKKEIADLRKDFTSQIDSLRSDQEKEKEAVNNLIKSNEMAEISRIRWEIIEFSNSLENDQFHVRDEYRHIKDEHKKYEELIKKYGIQNGIITEEIEKINKHYEEHKNDNTVYF